MRDGGGGCCYVTDIAPAAGGGYGDVVAVSRTEGALAIWYKRKEAVSVHTAFN